jgi:hypothetical protein
VADAGIGTDAAPYLLDIRPHPLRQTRQFIHQRNPGGEHDIGRIFGEFR